MRLGNTPARPNAWATGRSSSNSNGIPARNRQVVAAILRCAQDRFCDRRNQTANTVRRYSSKSLELLAKLAKLLLQIGDFLSQLFHFNFEALHSLILSGSISNCGLWRLPGFDLARQQMRPARLFRTRPPRQLARQRRLALGKAIERGFNRCQVVEGVHAF